jgi:hypothetical protein
VQSSELVDYRNLSGDVPDSWYAKSALEAPEIAYGPTSCSHIPFLFSISRWHKTCSYPCVRSLAAKTVELGNTAGLLKFGLLNLLLCAFLSSGGLGQQSSSTPSLATIIEGMERAQVDVRPQVAYQLIREYRLFGAKSSSSDSQVVAEVDFRPPSSKHYNIESRSGSSRGEQIVRRILDHEVEAATKPADTHTAAVNTDNYDFTYLGESMLDNQACYLLGLKPKRKDKDLISGQAWVDKHSLLVRHIEGEVAKTPSWWLKTVRVKLAFAYLEGTWLQTNMEAVADVRFVGPHTLTSRVLDYRGADVVASRMPLRSVSHLAESKH